MKKTFCLLCILPLVVLAQVFSGLSDVGSAGPLPAPDRLAQHSSRRYGTIGNPTQVISTVLPQPHAIGAGVPPLPDSGAGTQAIGNPIPRAGDQELLVVLVDFPDRAGLFTGQAWRQFFFGAAGFADYFKETSYNQLRYSGDVVGIAGGVPVTNSASIAYVRMPHPITYYADGLYGYRVGPGQFPKNNGGVAYHALQALDAAGFNFAPYANPITDQVDNLVVVFAGSSYRYTQDANGSLEATAYRLTWAGGGPFTSSGGQVVDNYTFCPDQRLNLSGLIAYIGICAHEHGHALGGPDLYDFSYLTSGNGYFDVMAYGAYGNSNGQRPFNFGAFSKEFLGWITPTLVLTGLTTVDLAASEVGANFIKLYPNGNVNSQEYFLLENRQPIGFDQDWTGLGLCDGLVIWHIDQNIVQNYLFKVNTLASAGGPPHQGVVVVEADGQFNMINPPINYGQCADTWAVGRTWDDNSTPNSSMWGSRPSNLSVTVLSKSDSSLKLLIGVNHLLPVRAYLPLVLR